jgi:hypothetical protein
MPELAHELRAEALDRFDARNDLANGETRQDGSVHELRMAKVIRCRAWLLASEGPIGALYQPLGLRRRLNVHDNMLDAQRGGFQAGTDLMADFVAVSNRQSALHLHVDFYK